MPRERRTEYVPITVSEIRAITERAVLVVMNGEPRWIPKSQLFEGDEIEKTTERTELYVSAWFHKKEGLEDA